MFGVVTTRRLAAVRKLLNLPSNTKKADISQVQLEQYLSTRQKPTFQFADELVQMFNSEGAYGLADLL